MDTQTATPQALLDSHEVAALLNISYQHVRRLRVTGQGPAFIKLPTGTIRYRVEDVEAWIAGGAK